MSVTRIVNVVRSGVFAVACALGLFGFFWMLGALFGAILSGLRWGARL